MRIYVLIDGEYGRRIVDNIIRRGFSNWIAGIHQFPQNLPEYIEDPSPYAPEEVPKAELVLGLLTHPDLFFTLPFACEKAGAEAVVAPIDTSRIRLGLKNQVEEMLKEKGIFAAFPRPFCSLTQVGHPVVDQFASRFGRPSFKIRVDSGRIASVEVIRSAPCGSSYHVAQNLIGVSVEEAVRVAGLEHQYYPCLASAEIDRLIGDSLMHISAHITMSEVERALREAGAL